MRIQLATVGFLLLAAATVLAQDVPMDEDGFAKVAAERVQRELTEYRIAPTTRLTLEGTKGGGETTGQLSLDRVYAFCQRNSRNCSAALDQYAKGISEAIKERDRPIDKGMVRIAVRTLDYVERLKKQMGTGAAALYSKPLPGGLAAVPVLDYTRSVRFAGEKDLPKLGLTEETLFSVGEENLKATSRPLAQVTPALKPNSLGSISGEDYASSRILFHEDWRELSEKLNGNLIVMIPAPDLLLYGDGSTTVGVEALRALGAEQARRTTRPLSLVVLRWTPSGWQVVK